MPPENLSGRCGYCHKRVDKPHAPACPKAKKTMKARRPRKAPRTATPTTPAPPAPAKAVLPDEWVPRELASRRRRSPLQVGHAFMAHSGGKLFTLAVPRAAECVRWNRRH